MLFAIINFYCSSSSSSFSLLLLTARHPNPKDRPVFTDICEDYLYTDDETLLSWNTEDRRASQKASEIGAQLSEGFYLYNDLQRIYRTDDD